MLNINEIEFMKRDILEVINDWQSIIEIWTPLPSEEQPGWNPVMKEIVGLIEYDKQTGIKSDVRGVPFGELEIDVAGNKFSGALLMAVPTGTVFTEESIIIYLGHKWRIISYRELVGEIVLRVGKMVGD